MSTEEVKKFEKERFEFVLCINGNIICQRNFPVRNYNQNSIRSYELKEMMDNICGMNNDEYGTMGIIPAYLKNKTIDFLLNNSYYFINQTEQSNKLISDKEDYFTFEFKVDNRTVIKSVFSASSFHKKAIDIKEIVPDIISEIRNKLSKKTYTKKYLNVSI
jgi:hypothetical protein